MSDEAVKNFTGRSRTTRLADLVFEAGMLRRTPRSGYQFLGTGQENVAEHSFRTAMIGWMLAKLAGADSGRVAVMCLFHDLHEARTGDFNYVNKMYDESRDTDALRHALSGTGLEEDVLPLWEELEATESLEAKLAQDADQIDFIANLKEQLDLGNKYAGDWIGPALERLRTDEGRELARSVVETDHKDWWFRGPDRDWWASKNGGRR
ncbi:HD domain-containing protein [Paucidesulfovibrio longus]|uniref:HD domain-containing protein n=1 Tax=Paucidesulfovibrio longus TaxID=889 RepID=UPI0003B39B14|nr:HD domain-containing protein [Paucidesulfovibrio longus]